MGTRFTPTGVGTMNQAQTMCCHPTVHPHGCGDNEFPHRFIDFTDGSPPRVWGQSEEESFVSALPRFTPTGVGTM